MKRTILAAVLLAGAAFASPAGADFVPAFGTIDNSFIDSQGNGFGNVHRLLDLHQNVFEFGASVPFNETVDGGIGGADKGATPTLSTLGWTSPSSPALLLDVSQEGGANGALTVNNITVTIYDAAGNVLQIGGNDVRFSTGAFELTALQDNLQPGTGSAGFLFILDAAEQAEFAQVLAMSGSGNFVAGVFASFGCSEGAGTCAGPSNGGQDSIFAGPSPSLAVPGPIVGAGIPGLIAACCTMLGFQWRRRRRNLMA
jgi:hypothetical protein